MAFCIISSNLQSLTLACHSHLPSVEHSLKQIWTCRELMVLRSPGAQVCSSLFIRVVARFDAMACRNRWMSQCMFKRCKDSCFRAGKACRWSAPYGMAFRCLNPLLSDIHCFGL